MVSRSGHYLVFKDIDGDFVYVHVDSITYVFHNFKVITIGHPDYEFQVPYKVGLLDKIIDLLEAC